MAYEFQFGVNMADCNRPSWKVQFKIARCMARNKYNSVCAASIRIEWWNKCINLGRRSLVKILCGVESIYDE